MTGVVPEIASPTWAWVRTARAGNEGPITLGAVLHRMPRLDRGHQLVVMVDGKPTASYPSKQLQIERAVTIGAS